LHPREHLGALVDPHGPGRLVPEGGHLADSPRRVERRSIEVRDGGAAVRGKKPRMSTVIESLANVEKELDRVLLLEARGGPGHHRAADAARR